MGYKAKLAGHVLLSWLCRLDWTGFDMDLGEVAKKVGRGVLSCDIQRLPSLTSGDQASQNVY